MRRESDEKFVIRMRQEQKLAPQLIDRLVYVLRMVRSNCREHRWRHAPTRAAA